MGLVKSTMDDADDQAWADAREDGRIGQCAVCHQAFIWEDDETTLCEYHQYVMDQED